MMDFSQGRCYVLDGGLGWELQQQYPQMKLQEDPLWNARLLHSNPQAVEDVHFEFLRNGAEIIITASYQSSIPLFCKELNIDEAQALKLLSDSVTVAKRARSVFQGPANQHRGSPPFIAGSVGPYGACLHNMSEYSGEYINDVSCEELIRWHRPRVRALLEAGADLLACETIPAKAEAEALVQLLKEFPEAKAWVSFSCKDGAHTCYGDLFSEAVASVCQSPQVLAVGLNCTDPQHVAPLLRSAAGVTVKPFVVYPDGKYQWDGQHWRKSKHASLEKGFPLEVVSLWHSLGARIIGGCCHVSPNNIRDLRDAITSIEQNLNHKS